MSEQRRTKVKARDVVSLKAVQCEHGVIKGFCMTCFECEDEALRQHRESMSNSAQPCPSCSRLEAENARLKEERLDYERRWRDIYDIPLARLQLPDGSVPGGTVECAEAWHRIARERGAKLSALIASVREIARKWSAQGESELQEAIDREMSAAMGVASMRLHCARELQAALQQAIGDTQ